MSCDTAVQLWSNLYTLEIASDECLSSVRSILNSPVQIAVARGFQGARAQTFIDFLDRVLVHSRLDDEHRQLCLRLLSKICKAQRIMPASYNLCSELIRVGNIQDRGGYSEVSDGIYLGFAVAIKDLKTKKDDFDKMFKRFCREIVGWKHLSHPNILPLVGVSVSTDPYRFRILSEWMPNGNLIRYTESNPEENRLQLLSEVASGVTYLHGLGIAHGDLKGANILVDKMGTARIGDFGFMTMGDLGKSVFSESTDSSGGTVSWMSPELVNALRTDSKVRATPESDSYALGMVIYEVLTGLRPFRNFSVFRTMDVVMTGERPGKPDDAKSLGLSEPLWVLVELCWSKESSERPTARRLLDHLSDVSHTWVPPMVYPVTETATDSDPSSLF